MTARVRRISWLNIASGTLIAAGIIIAFIGHNTLRWSAPPLPPAWAGAAHETTLRDVQRAHRERRPALPRSSPVSIDIPSISVHATVVPLGLNHDGSIAVPPLTRPKETSWYDDGPAPGQPGAAAILGHVDAARVGPAVFYDLGEIRPGAKIYVRLRTGRTAIFEAYAVALYSKANFPTKRVFGHTSWPTLRLITCGGIFDPKSGHYLGNIVAFASYVGSRKLPGAERVRHQGPAWRTGADPAGLLNFAPAYSRDS
jgi:hypothetical protein